MLASIVFQQEGVGHVVLIGYAVRRLQPEEKVREMRYNGPGARAEPEGQVFKVVHLEQGHRGGRCVALRIDEGVGEGYTSHIVGMFDSKFQPNRTFRRRDRYIVFFLAGLFISPPLVVYLLYHVRQDALAPSP